MTIYRINQVITICMGNFSFSIFVENDTFPSAAYVQWVHCYSNHPISAANCFLNDFVQAGRFADNSTLASSSFSIFCSASGIPIIFVLLLLSRHILTPSVAVVALSSPLCFTANVIEFSFFPFFFVY